MGSVFTRWFLEKEGTTAVEFSMVGFPFILMIIGTIEMALMFTSQSLLQEATFTAARMIRTGQLQETAPGGQEQLFRDAVCDFAKLMIPCNQIQFQVQTLPSFSDADDNPPQYDADGNLINTGFDAGGVSDIVLIRVAYNYKIKTPMMQPFLSNHGGGTRAMLSTVVLETEPYKFEE